MDVVTNQTYGREQVVVDGKLFRQCIFNNSRLLYSGGEIPDFEGCQFHEVSLEFGETADNTLRFLSGLYQGGFNRAVDTIFKQIRADT